MPFIAAVIAFVMGSLSLAAFMRFLLDWLCPIPISVPELLMSSPAQAMTAFNPKRYFYPVIQLAQFFEWSVLIPSLPDWDQ